MEVRSTKYFWGPKLGPKLGFSHFLKLSLLVFLEIAYDDIFQQCLTSSNDEIHKKSFVGPNLGQNEPKSGLELGFQRLSQVWFFSFP